MGKTKSELVRTNKLCDHKQMEQRDSNPDHPGDKQALYRLSYPEALKQDEEYSV